MKPITILFTAALMLLSCTSEKQDSAFVHKTVNGTDSYFSTSPSDPDFKYNFREVLKIEGEDTSSDDPGRNFYSSSNIAVDSGDNIYIVDDKTNTVKKFDGKGKFLKSFGRIGKGPGEYTRPKNLVIYNDTLYISDPASFKIIKLDTEGNYLSERQMTARTPEFLVPLSNGEGFIGTDLRAEAAEKVFLISNVSLFDHSFNKVRDYSEVRMDFDPSNPKLNPMDFMAVYTAGSGLVYIADISEDKYQISAFSVTGKKIMSVGKGYRKVKLTYEEMKKLGDQVKVDTDEGGPAKNSVADIFNKAVHGIWTDKYGRLWVLASRAKNSDEDKELHFDIFENGIFKNSFVPDFYQDDTDFGMNVKIKFLNGRMYLIDHSGDNICVRVYEY